MSADGDDDVGDDDGGAEAGQSSQRSWALTW